MALAKILSNWVQSLAQQVYPTQCALVRFSSLADVAPPSTAILDNFITNYQTSCQCATVVCDCQGDHEDHSGAFP
jgi:hypothetical protein